MVVGDAEAVGEEREAADADVLADDEDHLLLLLLNGELGAGIFALHKSVEVGGLAVGDSLGDALDKVDKLLVLGDEVGLGVDFDDDAGAVDDGGVSHTLGGYAAGLLLGGGEALLAQPLNGLVHVSISGGEGLFAVHHADAGHFTQIFNISGGKSHGKFLLYDLFPGTPGDDCFTPERERRPLPRPSRPRHRHPGGPQ